MADFKDNPKTGRTENVLHHDEGDGTYSRASAAHLRGWDATDTAWYRLPVDHATGALQVVIAGGAGSGGTSSTDGAAYTASSSAGTPLMGARDDVGTTALAEDKLGIIRATGQRALHVNLRDNTGAEVSVGGGTQYDEDTASTAADKITMAGVVRKDTAATLVDTDGDRTQMQTDATGLLRVNASGVAVPVTDNSGSLTVDNGGTFAVQAAQSGTWTVQPGNTANTTAWKVDASSVAVPVTDNSGSLTVDNGGTFAVQDSQVVADNAGFTDGTTKVFAAGYIFDEVAGTALTENDAAAARVNANRAQVLVIEDDTTRGRRATVTAGNALKVDGSAAAQPVTDNSGSLTVDAPVGTPVFVTATPSTSGGWSVFNATSGDGSTALTNSAQSVKGSAGTLGGWYIYNPNSSAAYVPIYNVASGSVTVGTTNPAMVLTIPATSAANLELTNGIQFGTAISVAAATTAGGNAAPSSALEANFWFK